MLEAHTSVKIGSLRGRFCSTGLSAPNLVSSRRMISTITRALDFLAFIHVLNE